MELILASAIGVLTAAGVYMLLRLRTFPVILGLALLSYAVNVFIFARGRLAIDQSPILSYGHTTYTDPLPQALVLTAIVISFGMTAVLVMVGLAAYFEAESDRIDIDPADDPQDGGALMHWIILPVVMPALFAPVIGFVMRHDIGLARVASVTGTVLLLAVALFNAGMAAGGETFVYRLGDWPAPFGIVLVLDRLSALMVLLTATLALIVLIHAIATGWDARGKHFHTLFQFQLMGICGAFLTGDVFNLFVFFEVLLIASYGLMLHAGGRDRVRAGLQYLVMNLAGSTLFLFALGTLYASTGTLNIADLARVIPTIPPEEAALVRVAAMLLMIVFAVKAALFPVQFWLPGTYANASAPVAALFAIMTKVGAYAIVRVHTVSFGPGIPQTEDLAATWLFPAAIVTIAIGAFGVLGARRLMPLIAFSVLGSMGTLMVAVAAFSPAALTAALYYLVHSTFAAACLFLIADLVVSRRAGDGLRPLPATVQNGLFAALFFGAAIGMAGMPPLSGLLGRLLVLDALREPGMMVWAWSAILGGSLLTILGFARAGSALFWSSTAVEVPAGDGAPPARAAELAPVMIAIAILGVLAVFAHPVAGYLEDTALQIFDRAGYLAAVLGPERRVEVMLARLVPHPLLSLALIIIWLTRVNKVTLGNVILGAAFGLAIPMLTRAYWPDRPRLRNPLMIVEYIGVVLWDIVVANVQVALILLFRPEGRIRSTWITVPVDLTSAEAITVLAGTITMTPGTVSATLSADCAAILVHTLDTDDPDGVRDQIKSRYERRLKEIFE